MYTARVNESAHTLRSELRYGASRGMVYPSLFPFGCWQIRDSPKELFRRFAPDDYFNPIFRKLEAVSNQAGAVTIDIASGSHRTKHGTSDVGRRCRRCRVYV